MIGEQPPSYTCLVSAKGEGQPKEEEEEKNKSAAIFDAVETCAAGSHSIDSLHMLKWD